MTAATTGPRMNSVENRETAKRTAIPTAVIEVIAMGPGANFDSVDGISKVVCSSRGAS